jgi:hypothetical protein
MNVLSTLKREREKGLRRKQVCKKKKKNWQWPTTPLATLIEEEIGLVGTRI